MKTTIEETKDEAAESSPLDATTQAASAGLETATMQAKDGAYQAAESDVLALFGDEPSVDVTPVSLPVKGDEVRTFYIKRLSSKESSMLSAKAKRTTSGSIALRDKDAQEAHENALAICACVVKNAGSDEAPQWESLWEYDDVVGVPERRNGKGEVTQVARRGLLELSSAEGKMFLGLIMTHVYAVNPELNPFLKKKADEILTQQLSGNR